MAQTSTPNDVSKPVTPNGASPLTDGASCVISQIFGDGSLPAPSGIIATSSGTQAGRLYRDGVPSTCSYCPIFSIYPGATNKYETYTFKAANTGCLNVSVVITPDDDYDVFVAVYSGSYNPSNFVANGIGQQGSSGSVNFACPVIAGQTYVLVVQEVYSGAADGTNYSVSLDNVRGSTPVPVPYGWIFGAFALIAISVLVSKRKYLFS